MSVTKNENFISIIGFIIIFTAVIGFFTFMNPNFLTAKYFLTMFKNVTIIAIASIGLTFVIAVNHTDLSFYLTAGFSAMFMSWLISKNFSVPAAVITALIGSVVFGFTTGFAIGVARLPDIISTIAIGVIAYGCSYLFSNGQKIYVNKSNISFLNDGNILGIPTPIFFLLLFYIIFFILMEKTKYGTYIFAAGSNRIAARLSGINTNAVIIFSYILCTVFSSFAGMISTASRGNGDVATTANFLMPCFTAVFIGSAVFKRPNLLGTFLGAFFVRMMIDGVLLLGIPYYVGDLVTSILLIISLLISKLNTFGSFKRIRLVAAVNTKGGVAK
ncbi:MAG: ABC transporter permease [Proteiniphilum sp.]|jgi:ribose/xylose/arabinose/galactoside ABC-type transport system permease subunit|nr:ABC transporter permease [Proteiniphilum sp.]